jgi:hypothetical protein
MRRLFGLIGIPVAIACAASAAGCAGRVEIVSMSGEPIAGARVVPVTPSMNGSPALTDAGGKASVPRFIGGQGVAWIDVSKAGFEHQHVAVGSRWPVHVVLAPAVQRRDEPVGVQQRAYRHQFDLEF